MAVISPRETRTSYRIEIEYDGTDFSGWQLQPSLRTVQGCLEEAVETLFGEHVPVLSAGRTDAGVHATGQVAHFRTLNRRETDVVHLALNAHLPSDIRVLSAQIVNSDFHARHSARWRGYVYRIARSPVAVGRSYAWNCPFTLDVEAMRIAARQILGSHIFRAFAHEAEKENHYLSDVYRADWIEDSAFLELHIEANRFLHGMVRLLVGTFVTIGRGRVTPDHIGDVLDAQDIGRAGHKVPSCGLTLVKVGYRPWPEM